MPSIKSEIISAEIVVIRGKFVSEFGDCVPRGSVQQRVFR